MLSTKALMPIGVYLTTHKSKSKRRCSSDFQRKKEGAMAARKSTNGNELCRRENCYRMSLDDRLLMTALNSVDKQQL